MGLSVKIFFFFSLIPLEDQVNVQANSEWWHLHIGGDSAVHHFFQITAYDKNNLIW